MIERDNKDILLYNIQMENVRLNNENASLKDYISFLENELKSTDDEHAKELALKDEFIAHQAETISNLRKEKDDAEEDAADARKELGEARAVIKDIVNLLRTEQEIGRFNVPKNDPMCSKHPQSIIKGNPVMP